MKLTYKNFWPSFKNDMEMFERLFDHEMFREFEVINLESVFSRKSRSLTSRALEKLGRRTRPPADPSSLKTHENQNKKSIWYTGENIRPPFPNSYNATLSFDQDTFDGTNIYLPLFYLRLLFPTRASKQNLGAGVPLKDLTLSRESDWLSRTKFACTFINNPEPTRLRAVDALSELGRVDIYGKYRGQAVTDKYSVAKDYRFMICFENGIYPGYVTEKLLDAYICGSIPIYWGELGKDSILNPKSFINYRDFSSLKMLTEYIQQISEEELEAMSREPLLLIEPNLDQLRKDIHQALKSR